MNANPVPGYGLFSWSIRRVLGLYFSRIVVSASSAPVAQGPLLLAGNHPNMALDPLLILATTERPLWFLAKSTLFRPAWVGWILHRLHFIPVFRKIDSSDTSKNNSTFSRVGELLQHKRAVLIFPEGTSQGGRTILSLKTGVARMALETEAASDWQLGIAIQPIGITYDSFLGWNSGVTISRGAPITMSAYRAQYTDDPIATVRALTAAVEATLQDLTVHIPETNLTPLIESIHKLFQSRGLIEPADGESLRRICAAVVAQAPHYPEKAAEFLHRSQALIAMSGDTPIPLPVVIALPMVTLGIIAHYPPYVATRILAVRASPSSVELGSIALYLGTALFLVWYLLLATGLLLWGYSLWATFVFLCTLCVLGLAAKEYSLPWRIAILRLILPGAGRAIATLQDELIDELRQYEQGRAAPIPQ